MHTIPSKMAERAGHNYSDEINFIKEQALMDEGIHIINFKVGCDDNTWFSIFSEVNRLFLRCLQNFSCRKLLINRLCPFCCLCNRATKEAYKQHYC